MPSRAFSRAGVRVPGDVAAKDCVFFGHVASRTSCTLQNVWPAAAPIAARIPACGIARSAGHLQLSGMSGTVSDSVIGTINSFNDGLTIIPDLHPTEENRIKLVDNITLNLRS